MAFYRKSGGANVAPSILRRRSGSGWVDAQAVYRRSGGTWVLVWTSYTPPVLAGPASISWSGISRKPPVQYFASSGTTVTGGAAATSIQWTRISGDSAITCSNPNVVGAQFACYGGITGVEVNSRSVWRLTYSDGISTVTKDVSLSFDSF